jgi:hypothetical protein
MVTFRLVQTVPGNKRALQAAADLAAQDAAAAEAAVPPTAPELQELVGLSVTRYRATFERERLAKLLADLPPDTSPEARDKLRQNWSSAEQQEKQMNDEIAKGLRDTDDPERARAAVEIAPRVVALGDARARKAELDALAAQQPGEVAPGHSFRFLYDQARARYITPVEVQALALAGSCRLWKEQGLFAEKCQTKGSAKIGILLTGGLVAEVTTESICRSLNAVNRNETPKLSRSSLQLLRDFFVNELIGW